MRKLSHHELGHLVLYHAANKLIASDFATCSVVLLMAAFSSLLMPTLCPACLPRERMFTLTYIPTDDLRSFAKVTVVLRRGVRRDGKEEEGNLHDMHYTKEETEAVFCSHFLHKNKPPVYKYISTSLGPPKEIRLRDDLSKITG